MIQIQFRRRTFVLIGLAGAALVAALGVSISKYIGASRKAALEAQRGDALQIEARRLVQRALEQDTRNQLLQTEAKLAWAAAEEARSHRAPVPAAPGNPPPPSQLSGELGQMGILRPALIAQEDAPTVWTWGKQALRVPGLLDAVASREHESDAYRTAAQRAQDALQGSEASVGQWKAAYGAQEAATGHFRDALEAQRRLVRPWGAGAVFGTDGSKGLVVQRDLSVFRLGAEVTQRNTPAGASWDGRVQIIYRW